MIPKFSDTNTQDRALERTQASLKKVLTAVASKEILDGVLVDVALASGRATTVSHGLGRPIFGWIVVRADAPSSLWEPSGSAPPDPLNQILLRCSADVTARVWVF